MPKSKKLINSRIFYCFLLLLISLSLCAWWNPFAKKEKPEKEISPKETVQPAKGQTNIPSELNLEQKLLKKKQEELNDTEWEIEVFPSPETDNNIGDKDILKFTEGQMVSQTFENTGYSPSRYTVRIRDSKGSWETMQRDEEGKIIVFWRGDWENDQMKGMFSIQKDAGEIESYSFRSTNKKDILQ